nr:ATP synthase F0 subunit 8 [Mycomya fimbriata]
MPQMAPINWLSLFYFFTIIYLMFCVLNYYNFFLIYPTQLNQNNKNFEKKYLNWKW